MKRLLKSIPSEARIVLVILVAIVLPSVLLSILAVWAIGAERSQVQERIRREGIATADRVVQATMSTLNSIRAQMVTEIKKLENPEGARNVLGAIRSSHSCICNFVLLQKGGAIVYPAVPASGETALLLPSQPDLYDALHKAQNLEFVQTDFSAAEAAYREVFEASEEPGLKSSALLGIAKILAKQDKWLDAVESYRAVRDRYGNRRDENGLLIGPAAALRIAQIALEQLDSSEHVAAITDALANITEHRRMLTPEEATFLDSSLLTLARNAAGNTVMTPGQKTQLQLVIDDIMQRRNRENWAVDIARMIAQDHAFTRGGLAAYAREGTDFVALAAPVKISGDDYVACILVPVANVERDIIAPQAARLADREEVGVVVTDARHCIVVGEAAAANSYQLGSKSFPEPLYGLRAEAYLKGYESLAALSSIRTNIYVWAVGLAISGIVAGAIVTYISVIRTMRAAELKSDFVSNVTHELKTPLTSIRMFAETLQDGRVKDENDARECLETIVSESERLSRLIDRVLDLRAIEKGKRKFDFKLADLREVILGSLQTFRRQMRGYEATVYVNVPHELPHVKMDPDAIGEVLLNLLTNSYKYSRPEDRRIWVRAHIEKSTVKVSVEDKGVGIPKRELKAIFEKFYRVDDTLTREVDGTGLGLTISRYVAEAHGGTIDVESKEGEGSKFTLVLNIPGTTEA
jgi:signal transduction histidine kinase